MFAFWMAVNGDGKLRRKLRCGTRRFLAAVTFINVRLFMLAISSLSFTLSGTFALVTARSHTEIKPTLNVFAAIQLTVAVVIAFALCAGICPWRPLRYYLPVGMEVIWTMSISPVSIFTAFLSVETLYSPPTAFALSQLPKNEVALIPMDILKQGYAAVDTRAAVVVVGSTLGAFMSAIYCILLASLSIHDNRSPLRLAFSSYPYCTIYNTFVHSTPYHHRDNQRHTRAQWHTRFRPTQFCNAAGHPTLFVAVPSVIDVLALWTGEPFWAYGDVGVWRWRWRWRFGWGVREEQGEEESVRGRGMLGRERVIEREERENVLWGRFMVVPGRSSRRDSAGVCVRREDGSCSCEEKGIKQTATAVNAKEREGMPTSAWACDDTSAVNLAGLANANNSWLSSTASLPSAPIVLQQHERESHRLGHARSRHQPEPVHHLPAAPSSSSLGTAPSSQFLMVPGQVQSPLTQSPALVRQRSASAPYSLSIGTEPSMATTSMTTGTLGRPSLNSSSAYLLPPSHSYSFEGVNANARYTDNDVHPRSRSQSQSRHRARSPLIPFPLVDRYRQRSRCLEHERDLEIVHRRVDPTEYIEIGRERSRASKTSEARNVDTAREGRDGQSDTGAGSGSSASASSPTGGMSSIPSVASLVKVPTESERRRIFVAFEV